MRGVSMGDAIPGTPRLGPSVVIPGPKHTPPPVPRGGKQVFLVEVARPLPRVVLVLITPADAEVVQTPIIRLGLPFPEGDVDPSKVDLVLG